MDTPAYVRINGHKYTYCECGALKDVYAATCRKCDDQHGERNHNYKHGQAMTRKEWKKLQMQRYPERWAARKAVANANRSGKLVLGDTCYYCGSKTERIQAHHWHGYAREHWLDVVPTCRACHDEQERLSKLEG